MSRARTWSVRLSVDELNASICLLETDAEMAAWARGLMRGLNAGENKPGASDPYTEGWQVGRAARQKADDLRAQLSENGSGDKETNGAANGAANVHAIVSPKAAPIGEPERRTNNEELRTKERKPRQAAFTPPTIEEVREHAAKIGVVDPDKFFHYHASRGWIVGKAPMKSWTHAMQTWLSNQKQYAAPRTPQAPQLPLKPEPDYANDPRYRPAWVV